MGANGSKSPYFAGEKGEQQSLDQEEMNASLDSAEEAAKSEEIIQMEEATSIQDEVEKAYNKEAGYHDRVFNPPAITSDTWNKLSRSQRKNISRGDNTLRDHLLGKDTSGIAQEKRGKPVYDRGGEEKDHVAEGQSSLRSLSKSIDRLENSLENPKLSYDVRHAIAVRLGIYRKAYDLLYDLIYGGEDDE